MLGKERHMRPRFAMLASLLAVLAAAVAPGIAGAAPHHNHGLTINATPNPIVSGEGVLIYGQIKGSPVDHQPIVLYHRVGLQRHFTVIGHTTTDAFGFYKFTREEGIVTTNRSWFVRGPNGSHSRTVHERVSAQISIAADKTAADTRQPITFSGAVSPSHAHQRVLLQAQTGKSDDWHTLKTGRLDATSHYAITYRWAVPGDRDVRVVLPADPRNIRSESDAVTVTIQQAQVADFTINTSQPIIPIGSTATISGVLDQQNTTTPEPNTSVSLWSRGPGQHRFHKLTDTTTATDGTYSFTQQPSTDEVYQVRTTLPANRRTSPLFEGVRDVLAMQATPTTTAVGAKVTFTGSVTPDKAGHLVYLQRLGSDGDWHTVEVRVVRPSSTFQFGWAFGRTGTATFRARIFSDNRNIGGASAPVTITVNGVAPVSTLPPAS
jgi:hypothetical protein